MEALAWFLHETYRQTDRQTEIDGYSEYIHHLQLRNEGVRAAAATTMIRVVDYSNFEAFDVMRL